MCKRALLTETELVTCTFVEGVPVARARLRLFCLFAAIGPAPTAAPPPSPLARPSAWSSRSKPSVGRLHRSQCSHQLPYHKYPREHPRERPHHCAAVFSQLRLRYVPRGCPLRHAVPLVDLVSSMSRMHSQAGKSLPCFSERRSSRQSSRQRQHQRPRHAVARIETVGWPHD